jgi:hypothetical protein
MGNTDSRIALSDAIQNITSAHSADETLVNSLFSVSMSVEDIYEILTPELLREVRAGKPQVLLSVLSCCILKVYDMYEKSLDTPIKDGDVQAVSNAIRILTRLTPFINDDDAGDEFASLVWKSSQFPVSIDEVDPECVGFRIIGALMRSAFIRGYTLPNRTVSPAEFADPTRVDGSICWGYAGGIAGLPAKRSTFSVSRKIVENRVEVVRLFLTTLSRPLFQSMDEYCKQVPIFNQLITSGDFIHTSNLFVSLLITVLEYNTARLAIPILSNTLGSEQDDSIDQILVSSCLNLINALIDPPTKGEEINVFREIIASGINEKEELVLMARFLKDKVESLYHLNSSLSVSLRYRVHNLDGFLLLVFNLVSLNGSILSEIRNHSGRELILACMGLLTRKINEPTSVGLVHTCSFILLRLSSDREFVVTRFGSEYKHELDISSLRLDGVLKISDLVVSVMIKLIAIHNKTLSDSLIEMWLTIACNLSAFVPGLSSETSKLVLILLERMTRPVYILGKPNRYHSASFLIEFINNCLQYQYEGNFYLVYCLLLTGPRIMKNFDALQTHPDMEDPALFEDIKLKFNIEPIKRLIGYLGPRVEEECLNAEIDHNQVVQVIRRTSVVGILPVPHPIIVRQYQHNEQTRLWFTSYLWGVIFTAFSTMPIFDWERVKMVTLTRQ